MTLTFTPNPALPAIPQTASLALTPQPAQLAVAVVPMDITLSVRREVSTAEYIWIPVLCGFALAVLLVGLTGIFGVPRPGGRVRLHRARFWQLPLHASAAWSFGDSWATNITAVSTVIGAVLTASGSVAELIPGVELGRFGLLIALAGVITAAAPLLFGWLNCHFGGADQTIAGVAVISLPQQANAHGVQIIVPAGDIAGPPRAAGADADEPPPAAAAWPAFISWIDRLRAAGRSEDLLPRARHLDPAQGRRRPGAASGAGPDAAR